MVNDVEHKKNNETITQMVVFGATGDVAQRYVFPALSHVCGLKQLPDDFSIVGVGRRPWKTPQFQEYVSEILGKHRPPIPAGSRLELLSLLSYRQMNTLTDPSQLNRLFSHTTGTSLIYLGLPANLFGPVLTALQDVRFPRGSRIVIEKPFGLSYAESRELNRILDKRFPEASIFRMDHFLGKPTVENILSLRFDNRLFEPIWNRQGIQQIEITWNETLALEGRGAYYDRTGALKDMIQNHLLQMLAVLTMETNSDRTGEDFRDQRLELFRSIRKMSGTDLRDFTSRARYRAGTIEGKPVPDYVSEEEVDPERETETFARVTFWIDNPRWMDVPCILQSGKAFGQEQKEIRIVFRQPPGEVPDKNSTGSHNLLRFNLETDTVDLRLCTMIRDNEARGEPLVLDGVLPTSSELPPYARLFLEALSGNQKLFVRNDEAEEMWNVIQPIADGWAKQCVPLQQYKAGSNGPRARPLAQKSSRLLQKLPA